MKSSSKYEQFQAALPSVVNRSRNLLCLLLQALIDESKGAYHLVKNSGILVTKSNGTAILAPLFLPSGCYSSATVGLVYLIDPLNYNDNKEENVMKSIMYTVKLH